MGPKPRGTGQVGWGSDRFSLDWCHHDPAKTRRLDPPSCTTCCGLLPHQGRSVDQLGEWHEGRTLRLLLPCSLTQIGCLAGKEPGFSFYNLWRQHQTHWWNGPWSVTVFLQVFEELLLDADWSVNAGSWMWLSCSAFFQQFFHCYCPVGFGRRTDPSGDYIR